MRIWPRHKKKVHTYEEKNVCTIQATLSLENKII